MGLVVFVALTLDVRFDGRARQFDAEVSDYLDGFGLRDHGLTAAVGWVLSQTGGRGLNLVWILLICVLVARQQRTLVPLVQTLSACALMYLSVYLIKEWLDRSFPENPAGDYLHASPVPGGAFPSGHQVNATMLVGVGAWITVEYVLDHRLRRIVLAYAVIAPVICAVAVLLMNYHWLTDVIGGTAIGVTLLWVVRAFWESRHGRRFAERLVLPPPRPRG